MNLSCFRVQSVTDEVFYIPEFVSIDEENYLIRKITESGNVKWKTLPNRRLQIWGGELTPSNSLIPKQLPRFITDYPDIIQRLRNTGVFASSKHGEPNHIIVNEYQPGQGIMPHEDGPSYFPVVATLSLGSHAVFNYHRYCEDQDTSPAEPSLAGPEAPSGRSVDPRPLLSLLLEPRSLVITAKELYTQHLHGIEPLEQDVLAPHNSHLEDSSGCDDQHDQHAIQVANWRMLRCDKEMLAARKGGVLERKTRISLTCREVENVLGGKGLGNFFRKQ
ncbi:hypothetical protein JB92DRAFT_2926522 [Gautieria morchelliformis]|nr:hypothetical protein JB92DRAFT_2926522 [Gautieria morchelliformis]